MRFVFEICHIEILVSINALNVQVKINNGKQQHLELEKYNHIITHFKLKSNHARYNVFIFSCFLGISSLFIEYLYLTHYHLVLQDSKHYLNHPNCNKYSPSSPVTNIPLIERQRLGKNHLSISLGFFSLKLGMGLKNF